MEQNIKELVDRIPREADIQTNNYSVNARITDINSTLLKLVEKSVQIGSKVPISSGEANSEEFEVVSGLNTFVRTIKDVPIQRVDFKHAGSSLFSGIPYDQRRLIAGVNFGGLRFWANEKQIFVEEGVAGTARITYARGAVTLFTAADYALESGWPTPDILPATFHDLLWLIPAYRQSKYYKKDRAAAIKEERDELMDLFNNHYGRESATNSALVTEDDGIFGGFPGNHR